MSGSRGFFQAVCSFILLKLGLCGHHAQEKLHCVCLSQVTLAGRGFSSWTASHEKRIQKEELGFVVAFGFVLLILSPLKGWGKGGIARLWQTQNSCVHIHMPTCTDPLACDCFGLRSQWRRGLKVQEWEHHEQMPQLSFFYFFNSTWFWIECLYMLKWHLISHPAAWKCSFLFLFASTSFLSCVVSFLTIPRPSLLALKLHL